MTVSSANTHMHTCIHAFVHELMKTHAPVCPRVLTVILACRVVVSLRSTAFHSAALHIKAEPL